MGTKVARVLALLSIIFFALPVFASETQGTIDATHKYAWGENTGWINFAPKNGDIYSGLTITDTAITGYAWSKEFGWINFNPTNSGQGVKNTTDGVLSGQAWAASLGWIPIDGVTINSVGKFVGTAGTEGSTPGRISFDCDACNVTTDWRPLTARTVPQAPTEIRSGGGGGSIQQSQQAPVSNPVTAAVPLIPTLPVSTTPQVDHIAELYTQIQLPQPVRKVASDYVESYNAPLAILPDQHGLVAYAFAGGGGVITQIPKHAVAGQMTVTVFATPALPKTNDQDKDVFGDIKFTVIAKDTQGTLLHHFAEPLSITLTIPQSLAGESGLGVYWFDTTSHAWVLIPDAVFSGTAVSFKVNHLTEFAILKAKGTPVKIVIASAQSYVPLYLVIGWFIACVFIWIIVFSKRHKNKKHRRIIRKK